MPGSGPMHPLSQSTGNRSYTGGDPTVREPEFGWTIYDLLRKLVNGGVWQDAERRAAAGLIDHLEANNLLGQRALEIVSEEKKL